jgi:hypothetical protein
MPILLAALVLGTGAVPDIERPIADYRPLALTPKDNDGDDDDDRPASVTDSAPNARDADTKDDTEDDDDEGQAQPLTEIVVLARSLDAARTQIDAGLGSSIYALSNETIENRPGGETGSIASILSQAPGVTSSAEGLTVRGSAANQIRVNNVIIPETVNDPADHISSRFADTSRLLTGTLPAQFGFAPAGVISVTTKNGLYQHGGEAELFGGTDGSWEPALEWAGSAGGTSMFGSGNYEHGRTTVADAAGRTARDNRDEFEGLGFADHVIGEHDRVSLLLGGTDQKEHMGATSLPAGVEHAQAGYGVATYQHSGDGFTVQASAFGGASSDEARFGVPSHERRSTYGTQIDASAEVGKAHVFRFGLLGGRSTMRALETNGSRTRAARTTLALYGQDEWKITTTLTLNPGVRAEWLRGVRAAVTFEPRASLVWQTDGGFSAHAGYARFAAAPALGEEPAGAPLADERDDYLDLGIQQRLGPVTLGLDAYERWARNYLAEHRTVGSATPSAFAFRDARFHGVEFSATYARRGTSAWANLALAGAKGRSIVGAAGLFTPTTLAASAKWVPLASERPFTLSTGLTQRLGKLSLSSDLQVSSGAVWTGTGADPNGERHSSYAVWSLAAVYRTKLIGPRTDFRLDATDLTNVRPVASDATALEGGWTRRIEGRAVSLGIEQAF